MGFSYYDPHSRYRARFMQRLTSVLLFVFLVASCIFLGFWVGREYTAVRYEGYDERIQSFEVRRDEHRQLVENLRTEVAQVKLEYEALKEQYNQDVPQGAMRLLFEEAQKHLSRGVDEERLLFVMRSLRPPQNCHPPETRRFVVSTPAYTGPDSAIIIAEGGIQIKGSGQSVVNENDQPEAWFDPAKQIELTFTDAQGNTVKKRGILPLSHTLVSNEREYRFTIEAGAQSFVRVVFDSCDYP